MRDFELEKILQSTIDNGNSVWVIGDIHGYNETFDALIEKLNIEEKDYNGKVVILADDVINSGKTMIYGVKHFLNVPVKKINTTALIDRKHLRFPIRTDYAGLVLSTSIKEHVAVELGENEGVYVE